MKPEEVLHNWDIPELANLEALSIEQSSSGNLHKTFLIRKKEGVGKLFVLQYVHPAVSMDGAINNYFHVTQFLQDQGLTMQTLLPTKNGALWIEGSGEKDAAGNSWRWRLLQGVEGKVYDKATNPDIADPALAEEAGKILGQFEAILTTYPKKLEPGRKSFVYDQEIEKLNQYQKQFAADTNEQVRTAAELLHVELPKLLLPIDLPKRIIHADPKITNFVFTEDGKGICMIDLDTVQLLSPLFDIADAVRSWCGQDEADPNNTFNKEVFDALLKGYFVTSKGLLSEKEQSLIPQACQLVMLGLAARFLNDYIDDSYFGWDEARYNSRKDHNLARAVGQISLYQSFLKSR